MQKRPTITGEPFTVHRDVLSSQEAILQLLSALLSLTSVFGMGTGVSSVPSSRHDIYREFNSLKTESICFFHRNLHCVQLG